MPASARVAGSSIDLRRDMEDLRQGFLTWLAILALLVAWVATYARWLLGPEPRWTIGASLAAGAALALLVRSRHPALGRMVFVLGVLGAVGGLMWLAPHSAAWQAALVALLLCAPLFSPRGQMALTAAFCTLYVLAELSHPPSPHLAGLLSTVGLLAVVSVSSWLSTLHLLRALDWATRSANHAVALREQLRDRQRELNSTVKALHESQYRIDRANRELTLTRNQAEEARHYKARFAAILSHELRAPLNLIVGFSEMMVLSPESYDERLPRSYRSDLHEVYRASRAMLALIEDLLDLAQLEARQLPIERDEVDLGPIIEETLSLARAQFRDKPVAFRLEAPSAIPPVFADSRRMRQVLLNLLSNAGRFTDQGSVTVRVQTASDQELQVTVADTGMGIAAEGLARIFAEFRQVDRSIQRQHGGTGLGLAVSKELIDLHGGRMWAESELGRGSQFHFTLPLVDRQASLALLASPPTASTLPDRDRGLHDTFLVIGDDPGIVRRLQRYVEAYRAVPARDAETARSLVTQLHPRAIVVPMGAEDPGPPAPDKLLALTEFSVPVICVSLTSQRRIWREMGVKEFLQKPVGRDALLSSLEAVAPQARDVLVIDDEPAVLTLLSRIIRSLDGDHVVHTACGGREGLEMLQGHTPDLILLDLLMPEVDGLAVLSEIQRDPRLCQIPVVIVSAQTLPDDAAGLQGGRLAFYKREALTHGELVEGLQALLHLARPRYVMPYDTSPERATGPLGEPAS
jgi:signal transduction histidine kinase/CheY-like chemotaxis protein